MHRPTATPSSKYANINRLACVTGVWKGTERGRWARKKREGAAPKHPLSLPFQAPATQAIDGLVRLYNFSLILNADKSSLHRLEFNKKTRGTKEYPAYVRENKSEQFFKELDLIDSWRLDDAFIFQKFYLVFL